MKRHIIKIVITFILIFVFFCSSAITSVVYSAPECSCGNSTVEDLVIHADGCARKAYCRDISSKTPQELFDLWKDMPNDVREFLLTYLSWTNQQKLQALNDYDGLKFNTKFTISSLVVVTESNNKFS